MKIDIKIVANVYALNIMSRIDIFKIDLGQNLSGPYKENNKDEFKFKISDNFIKMYKTSTNRIIYKFGDIGTLLFYDDPLLDRNEMLIFKDKKIYDVELDMSHLLQEPRNYLSYLLENVDNIDKSNYQEYANNDINEDDNEIKRESIENSKELSKDEYYEAMIEKRKRLG